MEDFLRKVKFEIERKYETNPDDFSVTDSKREREGEGEGEREGERERGGREDRDSIV